MAIEKHSRAKALTDHMGGTLTDAPCTAYRAKLSANGLMRRSPSDSVERFTSAIMDSQVDWNPHQVDAAGNTTFVARVFTNLDARTRRE